ncbi:unnamed protein product [Ostreobium quekettii]|uniref:Mitochondrial carrier protein n=1 Tax=Ostreobium quekettii TaxID=121088 RepID=A0A8S1JIQ7_9CHLO|nr:unnamed protein product [Ostreobium quekettii]|eukprot:evm.model.scf_610.3 EVM.evm.TU.scf_610.3   scf_610:19047-25759(+)
MASPAEGELGIWQRTAAAGGAAVLSVLVTTPLDVVKNRMQAQQAAVVEREFAHAASQASFLSPAACHPDVCLRVTNPGLSTLCAPSCSLYESTWDGMRKIIRQEGAVGLWRGTNAGLLTAAPMVGMYLPMYDYILQRLSPLGIYAPVAAGCVARIISMFFVAPLDLLRTRMQVASSLRRYDGGGSHQGPGRPQGGQPSWKGQFDWGQGVTGRVRMMWRGYGASVLRDVPFSAVYWGLLEPMRSHMLANRHSERPSQFDVLTANVVAGSTAGSLAALVTTPFDVVKTRQQVAAQSGGAAQPPGLYRLLIDIGRKEGLRGLFSGVGPRVARAAPACAIVLSTYETLKTAMLEEWGGREGWTARP